MKPVRTKLTVGGKTKEGILAYDGKRIFFQFGYWPRLNEEIKMMAGYKWHGYENDGDGPKVWSVLDNDRNRFQIAYLKGENPYARYDQPLVDFKTQRPLFGHQKELAAHALTVHYCIWAAEMGTGKTLAMIETMEAVFDSEIKAGRHIFEDAAWYVGPKSALVSVKAELRKWKCAVTPKLMTYEQLTKEIENWQSGRIAPRMVFFDESSRIKTPSAKRSQAALHLANSVRHDHGANGFVILMSGSPAPKSPADWWHQCEVACPGFLVEGNIFIFNRRVGIVQDRENGITGGKYAHLVSWKDSEDKCGICGEAKDSQNHDSVAMAMAARQEDFHPYQPCVNEVARLYRRMKGLVTVKFKKDCLDLPDKQYQVVKIKPSPSTLRAAKLLADSSKTAIQAMTLLRELSDGFQYREVTTDKMTRCLACHGHKVVKAYFDAEGRPCNGDSEIAETRDLPCSTCNATGEVNVVEREATMVSCAKDDALKDIIDLHDDVGKLVVYAGFTASIDRVCKLFLETKEWAVIRVDGRGWSGWKADGTPVPNNPVDLVSWFQTTEDKVGFVGHPGSAGMGLTLTASPTIVYFSNDFNAESRIQSEDRIHRAGMDVNRGATIIDLIHLPSDQHVLDNLKKKRDMQAMSLGEVQEVMRVADTDRE